jgi:predicted RNase H-like HicB family nuclease
VAARFARCHLVAIRSPLNLGVSRLTCFTFNGGCLKYKIALRHDEEGYSVSVPGLPGCWPQGATEDEPIANVADAIREYLAARDELLGGGEMGKIEVAV